MMHGQADDLLRDAVRHGKVFPRGRLQATVGREVADKGIEVPAAVDVPRLQFVVQLVPCHAILLRVHEDGEIGVVVPHAGHVLEVGDTGDIPQALTVSGGHSASCLDRGVDVPEVDQSHCRAHLVHLAVDARGYDSSFSGEPEVLQVVDTLLGLLVVHHERSALYRVVHLRGVEAEGGHVALVEDAAAVHLHPEGVRCVVDDLEAVLVGNLLYSLGIARLAVAVHRHDGRGPGGDGRFDAVGIDAAVRRVDVHEDGLDAVPPDRVGGGHEAERGGYHLAGDAQGLEGRYQRQRAVGEEADVGHLKVLAQGGLQFLVVMSVVGYPLAGPDVLQVCVEFVQLREERGRDGDLSVVHLLFLVSSEESECGVLHLQIFGQPECLAKADDDGGACAQLHQQHPYRT